MYFKNFFKLILFNFFFLISFLFLAELILGKDYRSANSSNNDVHNARRFIPRLICNKKLTYDASSIYKSDITFLISYNRDEECYRSYSRNQLPIVLTIGGSTTDQRYVSEGETFQDILDFKLENKFDVINGGVDGQTTFGHINSLEKWHSKYLSKEKVEKIIYYTGVNDTNFVTKKIDFDDYKYTFERRMKDFINDKSYIYTFIKNAYLARKLNKNGILAAAHGAGFKFNISKETFEIPKIDNKLHKQYSSIFKTLLKNTKDYFPNADIYLIQQQAPACNFINEKTYRTKVKDNSYCRNIGNVYLSQQKTIKEIDNFYKPKLLKMYLGEHITEQGIYDLIHTNNFGSKQIANYIYKNIFKDDL
tara:strand:+ start:8066 stop:9154 length:1089 start_codon:yes stop_codon:yes gene_type:complete